MKPELVAFFRHMVAAEGMDTSLGGARDYFKTLTPDAVAAIAGVTTNKQVVYNNIEEMLGRLVWKHGPHWTVHQYIPPAVTEVDMAKKKKVTHFRIIGDVHGKYDKYAHVASEAHYSLQVGDMGFDYSYLTRIVDSDRHKVIGGNHDNYTKYVCNCRLCDVVHPKDWICPECNGKGYKYGDQSKHFLGDYGIWQPPEFEPIFYVRGAWSIDWKYRTPDISWWEDEEIPYPYMMKAFDLYKATKPDFMVTHTCPFSIIDSIPFEKIFGNEIHKPRTEELLDQMYDEHQPKIWLFGHWHTNWEKVFVHPRTGKETKFVCIAELSYKDFPKLGEEVNGNK